MDVTLTTDVLMQTILCLCSILSDPINPELGDLFIATIVPSYGASSICASKEGPGLRAEYILSLIPRCDKVRILDRPIKFNWPNVERRIQELEGCDWGYYSCGYNQDAVSAFYKEHMRKPPYNMGETNWVDRPEGTLGIYYHSDSRSWIYLWVVPQSGDVRTSYVIVALANGRAFEPEC